MFLIIGVMAIFVGVDQAADASEQAALTPLQVTTKVSEEWKRSGKQFIGSWSGYGQRDVNSCGRCHDGYVFTTQDPDVPDIRWGNNEEKPASANQYTKASPVRPHAQGITCQACHAGFGKELMDAGSVQTVSLGKVEGVGKGATCFYCHDGRYAAPAGSKTVAEGLFKGYSTGTGDLNVNGVHYAAAGALVSGFGGMEYPDVTYPTGAHSRLQDSCVTCHMPTTNEGYATHAFKMSGDRKMNNAFLQAACSDCHTMVNEAYVDNFQAEIQDLAKQVRAELSKQLGIKADFSTGFGRTNPSLPKLDGTTMAFNRANVTLEQYVAIYNLHLVTYSGSSSYHEGTYEKLKNNSSKINGDGSLGVHNPTYAKALLRESLKRLQASAK